MGELSQARYAKYLKTVHWKRKREERIFFAMQAHPPVMPRTVRCNGCERFIWLGRIQVHHKSYENIGKEKISDLAVLCSGCHALEHGMEPPHWYKHASETDTKTCTEEFIKKNSVQKTFKAGEVFEQLLELYGTLEEVESREPEQEETE